MKAREKFFADISGLQFMYTYYTVMFRKTMRHSIDSVGADKILFASDFLSMHSVISNQKWFNIIRILPENKDRGVSFSTEEIEFITGGNSDLILS